MAWFQQFSFSMASIIDVVQFAMLIIVLMWVRRSRDRADEVQRTFDRLQRKVRSLCAGAAQLSEHAAEIEQQLRRLSLRQEEIDRRDPVIQSYDHATKLARNGASVEELIRRCGLVRDEAELLVRMHSLDKAS